MTEQAKREYAARSIAGGPADGASLLSAGAGSAPGAATATSSRSGLGGAASGAGEDEDETSALKGAEGGDGRAQVHHGLLQQRAEKRRCRAGSRSGSVALWTTAASLQVKGAYNVSCLLPPCILHSTATTSHC